MTNTASTYKDERGTWYVGRNGLRQRAPEIDCPTCGKPFISTPTGSRRYCSTSCRRATCRRCGTVFKATGSRSVYCSRECKMGSRSCEACGATFTPKKNTARRYCSLTCFYDASVPVGTRRRQGLGYVIIKVERGTPGATSYGNRRNWMLEHRLVMQSVVGRPLADHETVHHLNGQRDDNRPENLQLRSGKHGEGVRHRCLDCGSTNIEAIDL